MQVKLRGGVLGRRRWDWHAWQLFVACLPPAGAPRTSMQGVSLLTHTARPRSAELQQGSAFDAAVVALAAYARKDMAAKEALQQAEVSTCLSRLKLAVLGSNVKELLFCFACSGQYAAQAPGV